MHQERELEAYEFYAGTLRDALTEAGFQAIIQQTGGNTATIYARKVAGDEQVVGGPGVFNWEDPARSVFMKDDFWIGEDEVDDEGEPKEHDIPSPVGLKDDASIPEIVAVFEREYRRLNPQ